MCQDNEHIHEVEVTEQPTEETTPPLECYNCDCIIDDGSEQSHPDRGDTRIYCEDCFSEQFFTCEDCNNTYRRRYVHTSDSGESYCQDCYSERFSTCDWCSDTTDREDMCSVQDDYICGSCYQNHAGCCAGCSESFNDANLRYHERSGNYYCSECQPRSAIQSYHYEPSLRFKRTDKEQSKRRASLLYFGVELETASKRGDIDETAESCMDCWTGEARDHFYAKHDSSIDQNEYEGFELVSHPATYAWWMDHREQVSAMLSVLRNDKFESYTTGLCGMHIHVSKEAIGPVEQYKLQKLVYENPDLILKLSCRRKKDLVAWANCYLDQGDREGMPNKAKWAKLSKGQYAGYVARYVALNFTEHTIEFRIFRGTLAEVGFWRNMEIVQSMLAYVAQAGIQEVSESGYLFYVSKNRKDYPSLYSFIKEKMNRFGFDADEDTEE